MLNPINTSISFDETYSGSQDPLTLDFGHYKFENVTTIIGGTGQSAITVVPGAVVHIYSFMALEI